MNMTPENKAKLTGLTVRFLLYAVVGIVAIPFAIAAIKGWLLIIILTCLIMGTLTLAPALDMAARNWRLKLIKDQAKRNPVETMENIYEGKITALHAAADQLELLRGRRATYLGKLNSFKRRFPNEAEYWDTAADRLTQLLHNQEEKYIEARDAVKTYGEEVEKTKAIWEMGQAAAAATKGLKFTEDDFLTKIKTETSIDAAQEQLEVAFSALDQSLLEGRAKEPTGNPLPPEAKAAFQKALT